MSDITRLPVLSGGDAKKKATGENRLRIFAGELFANAAPLELSFNLCTRCDFCFAVLNGREKEDLGSRATLSHIVNVFRTGGNPHSLADVLLLRKHPIVFSNAVDPLFPKNLESTRAVLPVLQKLGVPVIFQTRGTDRVKDFAQYLDMLPEGSVLYSSLVTFDEEVRREVQRGSPRGEATCEMMAMAAERGFTVVAALNPVDQDWMGDPAAFLARVDEVAGPGTVAGTWIEPLHLSERQGRELHSRFPDGMPAIMTGAVERATRKPWVLDPYFFEDLFAGVDERGWKRYSYALPWMNKGRADLFDLWPAPFPTHHTLVEACREASEASGGMPVVVTFSTAMSWMDPAREVLDLEVTRGDAWYLINQKNNVDQIERKMMPRTLSLEECLRFLWNAPKTGAQAIYGAYGICALAGRIVDESGETAGVDYVWLREDDNTPLAVWAPQRFDADGFPVYTTDPKDRFRLVEEVEPDCVMLAPFDPDDVEDEGTPAQAG